MRWPGFISRRSTNSPDLGDGRAAPVVNQGCQITLDKLEKGQCGVVVDLELADNDDKRLRTLGICPGRRVWLVRRGDPMVLRVMNSRLGLAKALARQVTVEVCAPPCAVATDLTEAEIREGAGI